MLNNSSPRASHKENLHQLDRSLSDQQVIHSDLLGIIFEYLPNFFLLSPPLIANWRKVYQINNYDGEIANKLVQRIVMERLLKMPIIEGLTGLELLTEIVNAKKDRKYFGVYGTNPQMVVEKLGIIHNVNEWACLFERLWTYCTCGEKYSPKLVLDLKQLLMVNELVARCTPIVCMRMIHQSGLNWHELKVEAPVEFSLLYYEDEKCQLYKESVTHMYLLNDNEKWNVDFSKTPVRVRGELTKRNNRIVFEPYINWFSIPKESRRVSMRGCEGFLKKLKSKGGLGSDFYEDFLQRYWFRACVGESEIFYSYSNNESSMCGQVLNLIHTRDGRLAFNEGDLNEYFATKFPTLRHNQFGQAYSKCDISLKPKYDLFKAQIYPESLLQLFSALGGRSLFTLIFISNHWFFNWKYSRQFFNDYQFSSWGRALYIGLDFLTPLSYPFKAIYGLYHGFWLRQHVTLLESIAFSGLFISYTDLLKYIYSFRFTAKVWEGSFLSTPSIVSDSISE